MAYDLFQQTEDDKKKEADQQANGVVIGQGSPVVNSAGGATGSGAPTRSGNYTNLQDYLRANSGSKFGQEVTQKIEGDVNQGAEAQQGFDTAYKSTVDQNRVTKNDAVLNKAKEYAPQVAENADLKNAYTKMRDAQYKGPQSASDLTDEYSKTTGAINKAQEVARANTDESGRKAYLDQQYGSGVGRNTYNSGQQKLDNFLIQSDPNSQGRFEELNQKAQGLTGQFDQLKNALQQYSQGAKTDTEATRKAAREAIGLTDQNTFGDNSRAALINKNAQARAESVNNYRQADDKLLRDAIKNKSLSPTQLARLGIGNNFHNQSDSILAALQTPGAVDKLSAMSSDEGRQLQALAELAGIQNPYFSDPSKINTMDSKQVTSLDPTKQKYFTDQFNQMVSEFGRRQATNSDPFLANSLGRIKIGTGGEYSTLTSAMNALNRWAAQNGSWSNGNARWDGHGDVRAVRNTYNDLSNYYNSLLSTYGMNDYVNTGYKAGVTPEIQPLPDYLNNPTPGEPMTPVIGRPVKPNPLLDVIKSGGTVGDYLNEENGRTGHRIEVTK